MGGKFAHHTEPGLLKRAVQTNESVWAEGTVGLSSGKDK
jgi:hypothetical protein